jgi:hypothetical protein
MPYAHRPLILDADTHMMEHADWLPAFADPDIRPRLVPFAGKDARVRALAADAVAQAEARRSDATLRAEAEASFMSMRFKGWHGLGAFDAAERKRANDLMGFGAYLVFPTEAFNQVIAASDPEVLRGLSQVAVCTLDCTRELVARGPLACCARLSNAGPRGRIA